MVKFFLAPGFALGFCLCLWSSSLHAQSKAPGLTGGISAATVQLNPISPTTSSIKMGTGLFLSLEGQKRIGILNFSFVGSLDYLRTSGTLNYNYISPTNLNYVANQVNYNLDIFRATLALRYKIIENSFFRPYIEGGGSGGYANFTYDNTLRTAAVLALGNDYKTSDNALDFVTFGEAGAEIDLSQRLGTLIAARYAHQAIQPLSTFKSQSIVYDGLYYILGLYLRF